jgi:excisionase family DNA binding protein
VERRQAAPLAEAIADALLRRSIPTASDSALTVEETGARLGCGRTKVFELLAAGTLTSAQRIGRETRVTTASVEALADTPTASRSRPRTTLPPPDLPTEAQLREQRRRLFGSPRQPETRPASKKRG